MLIYVISPIKDKLGKKTPNQPNKKNLLCVTKIQTYPCNVMTSFNTLIQLLNLYVAV